VDQAEVPAPLELGAVVKEVQVKVQCLPDSLGGVLWVPVVVQALLVAIRGVDLEWVDREDPVVLFSPVSLFSPVPVVSPVNNKWTRNASK